MLRFAECGVRPALTLWFDVSVAEAMRRMHQRVEGGEKSTRLDDEAVCFHERVAAAFSHQFATEPERIVRVDAELGMVDVEGQAVRALEQRFGLTL